MKSVYRCEQLKRTPSTNLSQLILTLTLKLIIAVNKKSLNIKTESKWIDKNTQSRCTPWALEPRLPPIAEMSTSKKAPCIFFNFDARTYGLLIVFLDKIGPQTLIAVLNTGNKKCQQAKKRGMSSQTHISSNYSGKYLKRKPLTNPSQHTPTLAAKFRVSTKNRCSRVNFVDECRWKTHLTFRGIALEPTFATIREFGK